MNVSIGTKVTQPIPRTALLWPAVCISEPTTEVVERLNDDGTISNIRVTRADFISLRETREGEVYPALTNETVQYGYRPVAMPRFSNVVGLDVTEEGEVIDLQTLTEWHAAHYAAFAANGFEPTRGATAAADLL